MDDEPGTPSLADRIGSLDARLGRIAWRAGLALAASLLAVAIWATWSASRLDAEAQRIALDTASPAAARAEGAAIARAIGQPSLAATLAALAVRLPDDLRLVEAARGRDGTLRLTLDSPDPDALRARLRDDPWLARFHDRGESEREDGSLRVMLVEGAAR